jgi:hypothetical protein
VEVGEERLDARLDKVSSRLYLKNKLKTKRAGGMD